VGPGNSGDGDVEKMNINLQYLTSSQQATHQSYFSNRAIKIDFMCYVSRGLKVNTIQNS
jgi:hypothetical protein